MNKKIAKKMITTFGAVDPEKPISDKVNRGIRKMAISVSINTINIPVLKSDFFMIAPYLILLKLNFCPRLLSLNT